MQSVLLVAGFSRPMCITKGLWKYFKCFGQSTYYMQVNSEHCLSLPKLRLCTKIGLFYVSFRLSYVMIILHTQDKLKLWQGIKVYGKFYFYFKTEFSFQSHLYSLQLMKFQTRLLGAKCISTVTQGPKSTNLINAHASQSLEECHTLQSLLVEWKVLRRR